MDFLNTLFGKVWDITVEPVRRQFDYVISYKKNIDGLEEEAEDLRVKREDVQRLVDDTRDNNEEIRGEVQHWMRKVDVIMKEKGIFDKEGQANTGCSPISCPNLWSRYKLGRKAKKMALKIGELKGQGNFDKV